MDKTLEEIGLGRGALSVGVYEKVAKGESLKESRRDLVSAVGDLCTNDVVAGDYSNLDPEAVKEMLQSFRDMYAGSVSNGVYLSKCVESLFGHLDDEQQFEVATFLDHCFKTYGDPKEQPVLEGGGLIMDN